MEVAATFASAGILFYTASFAALETVVMFMVLAFQVMKKFEEDREKRRRKQIALGAEAERQRQETGESLEQAVERLLAEDWQPPQS